MRGEFVQGWRQLAACVVLLASCAMITSAFSVVAVPLAAQFHPNRMTLMLAMTVVSAVSGLLSPIVGQLMDRVSLRGLMALGVALLVSGFALLSVTTSFAQVLVVYGLFMAPANVLLGPMAATVLLSRWFVNRRGTALGIAIAGLALGGFIFPPVIQALLDANDWRFALQMLSLILAAITVPAVALVASRPESAAPGFHHLQPIASAPHADAPVTPFQVAALLRDPTFWMLAAAYAVVLSGMTGMVTNLVPLAMDHGITGKPAALLISIFAAGGLVAKLGFAAVADRVSSRLLLGLGLAGFACGMAALAQSQTDYLLIAVGVAMIGFFGGLLVPLQGLLIPRIWGETVVGGVSGVFNLTVLCAILATPPIFGAVYDVVGSYNFIFIAFGVLAASCLLILRYIDMDRRATNVDPTPVATLTVQAGASGL